MGAFECKLSSFNFREVKNVVNDAQKIFRRGFYLLNIVCLLFGEWCFLQQIIHTNDGVHWGSNFVGHVRKKFAFRSVRSICNFAQ